MADTDKRLKIKIIIRNDDATSWKTSNPVLKKGEMGIETDTGKFKFGDGVTAWNSLAYRGGADLNTYEVDATSDQTDNTAIAVVVGSSTLHDGDVAIVRRIINGAKKSYTAYVYDSSKWKAMDGNYNAKNVYIDSDIIYTTQLGELDALQNGKGTIAAGTSIYDIFDKMLSKTKAPKVTNSYISVSSSDLGIKEVGTKVSPSYTITENIGSYEFGPSTGVKFSSEKAVFNGETVSGITGKFSEVQLTDTHISTGLKITASATSSDGATPYDNKGNAAPNSKIVGGTRSATSSTELKAFRGNFYGCKTSGNKVALSSATIRALNSDNGINMNSGSVFNISVPDKTVQVIIALKNGLTLSKVEDQNAFGTNIKESFVTSTQAVNGKNGYTAINYNVYVYEPAAALGANTYKVTVV